MLDTGLSMTRGNSATLAYNLSAKAVRATTRDKITVYSTAVYATDDTNPPNRTTAHAIRGGIRRDFNISERVFVFGFTDIEYDQTQDLDLRNVLGGGLGYHIIKTKNTTFDVFGGADYEQEFFFGERRVSWRLNAEDRGSGPGRRAGHEVERPHDVERDIFVVSEYEQHGRISVPVRCDRDDEAQELARLAGHVQRPLPEQSVAWAEEK
jgi:hypothetical protein